LLLLLLLLLLFLIMLNPFYARWFINQPHVHSNVMMPTDLSATFLTCVKAQCGPQNAAAIT
jgi:hypothetical protein